MTRRLKLMVIFTKNNYIFNLKIKLKLNTTKNHVELYEITEEWIEE